MVTEHSNHSSEGAVGRSASWPTVSAVIPAYNAAGTIERALNSVYAQTYPNLIEVIVVDDGSQDDTCAVIERKYPKVKLLRQENAGSPTARNRGVAEAQGEYLAFLDDDDEWFPEKTAKQMAAFAAHPGLVFTIASALDVRCPRPAAAPCALRPLTFDRCFPVVGFHCGCSQWIIRKAVFEAAGGFNLTLRRAQDIELIWRVLSLGYATGHLTEGLSSYYSSEIRKSEQQLVQLYEQWYAGMMPVIDGYALSAPANDWLTKEQAAEALHHLHYTAAWNLIMVGKVAEARHEFAEAEKWPLTSRLQGLRHRLAGRWPTVGWSLTGGPD